MVPLANFENSETPIGPFQSTVLEFLITSANFLVDSGPISIPSQSEGICPLLTNLVSESFEKSLPHNVSSGKISLTPLSSAFLINSSAKSSLSFSQSDIPISPPNAFTKV